MNTITYKQNICSKYLRTAMLFLLALVVSNVAFAQNRVTGTVVNGQDEPLVGVTVMIKGSNSGTTTDAYGKYSINAKSSDVLMFEYIGHEAVERAVKTSKKIDIELQEEAYAVDDVVVVGYGVQRRSDLTGSVSSAKMDDVVRAPVASVGEALAGRMAGVNVSSGEGEPGSGISIVIRGSNSITQSNAPLYVVDGFPIEDFDTNSLSSSDIVSFDVLKDASATAIYGARGANGVIMITTRSGEAGKIKVNYDGSCAYQQVINKMEMMKPADFVAMQFEIDPDRARANYLYPDTEDRETRLLSYYDDIAYADWQEQAFQNAPMTSHTVSLTGGSKGTKYAASVGYMDQTGVIKSSGFDRYNGRLRLSQDINKNLSVGVNVNYARTQREGTAVRMTATNAQSDLSAMYNLWGYRSFDPDKPLAEYMEQDMDTSIADIGTYGVRYNPLKYLDNEERSLTSSNFHADGFFNYKFLKHFTLRLTAGLDNTWDVDELYYNANHPSSKPLAGSIKGIHGSVQNKTRQRFVNENTLTYNNKIGKHSINVMGDFSVETYSYVAAGAGAEQMPRDLGISALDEGTPMNIYSLKNKSHLMSYLGRANYNYDARYYLTASMRADGSSKFGPDSKWGYFPSGSFMWRVSQEKFLRKSKVISDLKLKTSYGLTGNNRIGSFDYMPVLKLYPSDGYPWNNSTSVSLAEATTIGNSGLKWESTASLDAGIEVGFLDNKITIAADYYKKNTDDLLLSAKIPMSSGYTAQMQNIGEVENEGYEFMINAWIINKKDFTWNSTFNISTNKSKVVRLENDAQFRETSTWSTYSSMPLYIARVGQPIAMFQGMKWDGCYQIDDFTWQDNSDPNIPHAERTYLLKDDVPTNGTNRNTIQPGHIKYIDQNGDLEINADDVVEIGDPNTKFSGGWSNTFTYKGFDLNLFFQFNYGNEIMNGNTILFEGTYRYGLNQFASYTDRWSYDNQDSENYVPKGGNTKYWSDKNIEDGSYLRLKTIQLGYTLPADILKKLHINSARVYIATQNVYTWTAYSGFDPEVSIFNSALTPGLDYLSYPRARTFACGVQIGF